MTHFHRIGYLTVPVKGTRMRRFDSNDIYLLGKGLSPLGQLETNVFFGAFKPKTRLVLWNDLKDVLPAVMILRAHPYLKLSKSCRDALESVHLRMIRILILNYEEKPYTTEDWEKEISSDELKELFEAYKTFETLLFGGGIDQHLYAIDRVRAYDTDILLEHGEKVIDHSLITKLEARPKVLEDVRLATRTLACGFWTASGFHVARATELLLKEYFTEAVKQPVPPRKTWVNLCQIMLGSPDSAGKPTKIQFGKQTLIKRLRTLGSDYRNPWIHPEHSLNEYDGVLLFDGCVAAINGLLSELP